MAVDPVLAPLAVAHVAEIDWDADTLQTWFLYNYEEAAIVRTPTVLTICRQQADETEVGERGHSEVCLTYRAEFVERGMSREFAEKTGRRFLLDRIELSALPSIDKQDGLQGKARSADGSADAAATNTCVVESGVHVSSSYFKDEDNSDLDNAITLDKDDCVGTKRRLRDLRDTCRAKNRRVPESFAEAFALEEEILTDPDGNGVTDDTEVSTGESIQVLESKMFSYERRGRIVEEQARPGKLYQFGCQVSTWGSV